MIRETLIGMGYREVKPKIWFKPVGYHLFCYNEDQKKWFNYFKSLKGVGVWESEIHTRTDTPFIHFLKHCESVAGRSQLVSSFEFTSLQDLEGLL